MNETIVVNDGQTAVATTDVSGTLSPASSATDTIAIVDTPSGKQAAVVTTSVSGTLSPESSITDTVAIVDTPSGKQAALKVYNLNGGGGGGSAPATKYGVSLDNLLGNVDANGVYQLSDAPFTFDAASIKEVPFLSKDLFMYKFYKLPLTGTVDFSNYMHGTGSGGKAQYFTQAFSYTGVQKLITPRERVGGGGMQFYQSFQHCDALKEIVFSNPIIAQQTFGFTEAFQYCDFSNASINFDIVTSIGANGFYGAFKYCKLQEEIRFTNLTEITATYAFREAFSQTTGCKRYFFPLLTSVTSDAFGSGSRLTWYNATDVEEIHFRADMQATIEAVTGYSSKFGATNCTIYFDL